MRVISNDCHWASTRAVSAVEFVSTAESSTERLRKLLTVSNSRHCIACTQLPYPAEVDILGLSKQINAAFE